MTKNQSVLLLASASPRRSEILDALGVAFTTASMDIDERQMPGEAADAMVLRLAAAKAAAGRAVHRGPVLGADTAVVVDGDVFGKPQDEADALAMLDRLSGRTHNVVTGVALSWNGGEQTALSSSEVRFRRISSAEALAYWQSGEPVGKAGAYAIQGQGGVFVAEIHGSYSGIVGLPVFETAGLLAAAGIEVIKSRAEQ